VPTRVSRNAENTLVRQLGEGVSVAILRWTWRQWLREFGVRDDAPFHSCCRQDVLCRNASVGLCLQQASSLSVKLKIGATIPTLKCRNGGPVSSLTGCHRLQQSNTANTPLHEKGGLCILCIVPPTLVRQLRPADLIRQ
jgi:hypothetical protein